MSQRWMVNDSVIYFKSKTGHEFIHPFLTDLAMMALFSWMAQQPPAPAFSYV